MVGAGDLVRSADGYRLSDRLLARQRRQDDAINPQRRSWDGTWTTLVITSVGTDARSRARRCERRCRTERFAELREGVWMRPDNLDVALPDDVLTRVRVLHGRDDDPAELAGAAVGSAGWARTGGEPARRHGRAPPTFPAGSSPPRAWCATC